MRLCIHAACHSQGKREKFSPFRSPGRDLRKNVHVSTCHSALCETCTSKPPLVGGPDGTGASRYRTAPQRGQNPRRLRCRARLRALKPSDGLRIVCYLDVLSAMDQAARVGREAPPRSCDAGKRRVLSRIRAAPHSTPPDLEPGDHRQRRRLPCLMPGW